MTQPPSGERQHLAKHQFTTLDALRGVAALVVLHFHLWELFGKRIFVSGYLAVDFFFLLSGFVLSYAYGKRLDEGWTTRKFLSLRWARLYPLYALGLALGAAFEAMRLLVGHTHLTTSWFSVLLLLGVLVLPCLRSTPGIGDSIFPLNRPSWSLFAEAAANGVHAVFLRRRSNRFIALFCAAMFLVLAYAAERFGSLDFGADGLRALFSIPRALFSYSIGILTYRFWYATLRQHVEVTHIAGMVGPPAATVLLITGLALNPSERLRVPLQLIMLVSLFPAVVLIGASFEPSPWIRPLFRSLGRISYAIYVLQAPVWNLYRQAASSLHVSLVAPWAGLVFLIILLVVSWLADELYDSRARGFLRSWVVPHPSAP